MNVVSNFVSGLSSSFVDNKINFLSNIKSNEESFDSILSNKIAGAENNMPNKGLNILDLNNNNLNNIRTNNISINSVQDMTTSEIVTFTKSLFDSSDLLKKNNTIYNFSRKNATDFYSKYSKNIAMNLEEFVKDTIKS